MKKSFVVLTSWLAKFEKNGKENFFLRRERERERERERKKAREISMEAFMNETV